MAAQVEEVVSIPWSSRFAQDAQEFNETWLKARYEVTNIPEDALMQRYGNRNSSAISSLGPASDGISIKHGSQVPRVGSSSFRPMEARATKGDNEGRSHPEWYANSRSAEAMQVKGSDDLKLGKCSLGSLQGSVHLGECKRQGYLSPVDGCTTLASEAARRGGRGA
ncbi:hypothetical protein SELMODRAFT_425352 [Selaginella moellendorffii]|uniref:Uncharacterized protein n=1 Tax=Selaginella moellendorffii TaxID=88036 RepID=D8SSU0_SELML|nr:hypothetical protein SELMODRAFT_425352 [Selaginella moellendorffii]